MGIYKQLKTLGEDEISLTNRSDLFYNYKKILLIYAMSLLCKYLL